MSRDPILGQYRALRRDPLRFMLDSRRELGDAAPMRFGWIYFAGALAAGIVFLVVPGIRWLREQQTKSAMLFFNRACFYPLAVFGVAGLLAII